MFVIEPSPAASRPGPRFFLAGRRGNASRPRPLTPRQGRAVRSTVAAYLAEVRAVGRPGSSDPVDLSAYHRARQALILAILATGDPRVPERSIELDPVTVRAVFVDGVVYSVLFDAHDGQWMLAISHPAVAP